MFDKYLLKVLLIIFFLGGCYSESIDFPKEKYRLFEFNNEYGITGDSIFIKLRNPVAAPIRVFVRSDNVSLDSILKNRDAELIHPFDSTIIKLPSIEDLDLDQNTFNYSGIFGDHLIAEHDSTYPYNFPFDKNINSRVIQGYNGSFSHKTDYSKYSVDFKLDLGDTIRAAREGIVVGIIDQYKIGGSSEIYRPFANWLVIYHNDGTFAQYLHLQKNSSFVNLGDIVEKYQPIALNGETGWTTVPHLHFTVLLPTEEGIISIPTKFNSIDGGKLKRGVKIKWE